jgi:uncharacterized membrane protein
LQTQFKIDRAKSQQVVAPNGADASCACLPVAALFVAFGGLFAAVVLGLGHILKLPVPCGQSGGCASVASHPSSVFLGVPIAFPGVVAYAAIIFALTRLNRASFRRFLLALTGAGTLISAALLAYAHFVIGAACWWCVASGVAMTILFLLSLFFWITPKQLRSVSAALLWWSTVVTVVGVGAEIWIMQRTASATPIPAEKLAAMPIAELTGSKNVRGPSDARIKIVVFSDLSCSVCRAVHRPLMDFQAAHSSDVQVIFRHRPLTWVKGHETSRATAAISEVAATHGQFWDFVERLYHEPAPLDRDGYMHVVRELNLPESDVDKMLLSPAVVSAGQLDRDIALADRLGILVTPVFVVIVDANPPISANHRQLADILNSNSVQTIFKREPATAMPR